MKKIIVLLVSCLVSFGVFSKDRNIEIKEIRQIAHSDGHTSDGRFVGMNTYSGVLYLYNNNYKTNIGYAVNDFKEVSYVFLFDMGLNPKDIMDNKSKVKGELRGMGLNSTDIEEDIKSYIKRELIK